MTDESPKKAATPDEHRAEVAALVSENDSLAPWLYYRFGWDIKLWADLTEDVRSFWEHEAKAVYRAVKRRGFKKVEGVEGGEPSS